jgi:hypothetical protein
MTLQESTLGSGKQPFKPGIEFRMRPYGWPQGLLAGRWSTGNPMAVVIPKASSQHYKSLPGEHLRCVEKAGVSQLWQSGSIGIAEITSKRPISGPLDHLGKFWAAIESRTPAANPDPEFVFQPHQCAAWIEPTSAGSSRGSPNRISRSRARETSGTRGLSKYQIADGHASTAVRWRLAALFQRIEQVKETTAVEIPGCAIRRER